MDRLAAHRAFYADLITTSFGPGSQRVRAAFSTVPRNLFMGEGPWKIVTPGGEYVQTPSADPTFLYQDVLVALTESGRINNGQPSLHALCLTALEIAAGDTVVHVGAGSGYYTAILSTLTGPTGSVFAYEIETPLAEWAARNLSGYPNVTVFAASGSEPPLPACDVLYVSAGATEPLDIWVNALRDNGRLLFPLTPAEGFGGMLLITRFSADTFHARFLSRAIFIPCLGARDAETARRLGIAFQNESFETVRSLRRHTSPDNTCWFAGHGWWLSTAGPL